MSPETAASRSENARSSDSPRVAIVIPTYNEAENLPRLCERLRELPVDGLGLIVVDDASPDGTGLVADDLSGRFEGYFRVIHRHKKLGLGEAYKVGFKAALEDGAETVIEMDADLSHPPQQIPPMLEKLQAADVVVGSRYVPEGGVDPKWNRFRRALSYVGNVGIRTLVGVDVRDATSGFKAFRRSALEAVNLESMQTSGFGFQAEVALACQRAGLAVVEHPYTFLDRTVGTSKMSVGIIYEAVLKLLPLRFKR